MSPARVGCQRSAGGVGQRRQGRSSVVLLGRGLGDRRLADAVAGDGRAAGDGAVGLVAGEPEPDEQVDGLGGEPVGAVAVAVRLWPSRGIGRASRTARCSSTGPMAMMCRPCTSVLTSRSTSSSASWWALPWGAGNCRSVAMPVGVDGEEAVDALFEVEPGLGDAVAEPLAARRAGEVVALGVGEVVDVDDRIVEQPAAERVAHPAQALVLVDVVGPDGGVAVPGLGEQGLRGGVGVEVVGQAARGGGADEEAVQAGGVGGEDGVGPLVVTNASTSPAVVRTAPHAIRARRASTKAVRSPAAAGVEPGLGGDRPWPAARRW